MKDYLLINQEGKELLQNKIVYESAKGSMFENTFKDTIKAKYHEEISDHLIDDALLDLEKYVAVKFKESDENVITLLSNKIKELDNKVVCDIGSVESKLTIIKQFKTNYKFNFTNLELLIKENISNFREEYLRAVMGNYLDKNSISNNFKKYISLIYDGDILKISLIINKDNMNAFEDSEDIIMIPKILNNIGDNIESFFKGKQIFEDSYSPDLNLQGNTLYRAFLEFDNADIDLISTYKELFTPKISTYFINKDGNGLIEFLKKYKKYQSTTTDRKQYEILSYWNRSFKKDILDYSAKKHITVGVEKGKIIFLKILKYDLSNIYNYDLDLIYPNKEDKHERESFIINIVLSRLSFVGEDKYNKNFIKQDLKNSITIVGKKLSVDFKIGFDIEEIKKVNSKAICDSLEHIYYKSWITK